ncbi:MAG: ParB/RepB/Spo0J family partition protein [Epsilonproteobacteria bacterium]|nr:ParB/RepB/Spo0J family partition protein [Campylobacterota bacterium]
MKRLGRGLGAILEDAEAGYLKELPESGVNEIDIEKIIPNPYQPRREFSEESIEELASSIKKHGLLQPVIVIKEDDKYILVAGERRLRASKKLGKTKIKAIVAPYSKEDLREYALIENIQREDLNPVEIAYSLESLIKEHGFTHEELAKSIGKSRSYVTNILRILSMPEIVKENLKQNKITLGHAKVLSGLDEQEINEVVKKIVENSWNVRDTEKFVKKLKNKNQTEKNDNEELNEELIEIAYKLKKMGLKTEIGKDYIKLKLRNETDFENLKKLLGNIN